MRNLRTTTMNAVLRGVILVNPLYWVVLISITLSSCMPYAAHAQSVCAQVKLNITQQAVIAGQAFAPSLSLNNGSGSALQQVSVVLTITDVNNQSSANLFAITAPNLSGLTAVDGTGVVTAGTIGSATWTIIPTRQAAPTNTTEYFVGGTLSYDDNGTFITIPLYPTSIQVMPEPFLMVKYFEERTVYGQDPFSTNIEPPVPFNLGILVSNSGYGTAHAFTISSGQPQIVENAKGLLVSFQIVGAQAGTNILSPSLTLDLGDISYGQIAFGRWLMTSSLQGTFTNFTASYQAVDDLGNTNLSIVAGVEAHALIHAVRVDQPTDDGLPDFLVNDTNTLGLPDTAYCSDGPILPVIALTNGVITGTICPSNLQVQLTAPMPTGWAYLQVPDPGQGNYTLAQVVRSDGRVVRLGDNAWTTAQTLHPPDLPSYAVDLLRIFDYNSTGIYTVTYVVPTPILAPTATTLAAVAITPTNAFLDADVNPNGAATGVYFEWGATTNYGNSTATTTLTGNLNTAQDVALAIGGLLPSTTNHYQAVAMNSAGNSYGGDMTVVTPPLPPPVITQVSNQFLIVGQNLVFTNHALAATPPITYSLGSSAPQGASITTNGIFKWTPACAEGSTTNLVTVWATDSGTPPLSNSMTFVVTVSECVQVGVGSTVVQVGQTSSVPVTLLSTVGITNLRFALASPGNRFINWTIAASNASIATATVQTAGSSPPVFTLITQPGQTLQSPSVLGSIAFAALPGVSAFLPVAATNIIGLKSDGSEAGNISSLAGQVVLISSQPLLEASLGSNSTAIITIYGNPGSNYQIAFSTNLASTNWLPAGSVLMTNLEQNFIVNPTNPETYYRTQ